MQNRSRVWRWLVGVIITSLSIFTFSGCASIIKGSAAQQVSLKTKPSDADCQITDLRTGAIILKQKSPILTQLKRHSGYFKNAQYRYSCEKEGYTSGQVNIVSSVNGWYFMGNLAFGGLVGWLIVDPSTGAMWSFASDDITLALELPVPASSSPEEKGVVLVSPSYFQGTWIGSWQNWQQEVTITVGRRNSDGTFDTEYSWGWRQHIKGSISPGTVKGKGREAGEKFVFEFNNPEDFRMYYIEMTKHEGGKARIKLGGQQYGADGYAMHK